MTLDPATGAAVGITAGSVALFGGLAVRSDGVVFANTRAIIRPPRPCRTCPLPDPILLPILATIDPSTGTPTTVGILAGSVHLGALDFSPAIIPEPNPAALLGLGLAVLGARRRGAGRFGRVVDSFALDRHATRPDARLLS